MLCYCNAQNLKISLCVFQEAFGVGGLPVTYSAVVTQLSSMLGFFVVLLIDRAVETCRSEQKASDAHELTTVKGYIVTVSSSDDTDDSDVELVQEKDSMLPDEVSSKHGKDRGTRMKKRRSGRSGKPEVSNGSASTPEVTSATPLSHGNSVTSIGHEELSIRSIVLLLALSLHSLFEGVSVGLQNTVMQLVGLSVGVTVHGCLVAFALGMALASHHHSSRFTIIRFGAVYSVMVPAGIGIGMAIGTVRGFVGRLISGLLQALTTGTFIYVIFVEIFPNEVDCNQSRLLKVLIMFVGFVIISCLRFVTALV